MKNIRNFICCFTIVVSPFVSFFEAEAVSPHVVISQVQLAGFGSGTAGQEFVELYNNSSIDVDVTGWCLSYTSSSGSTTSGLVCIAGSDSLSRVWMKARSHVVFVSVDYRKYQEQKGDGVFSYTSGMATTGGRVRLLTNTNSEIDQVSWGAMSGEVFAAPAPTGGSALHRIGESVLQDSDNFAADFTINTPMPRSGGLYETVIDVCPNLPDVQTSIPAGYELDGVGGCKEVPVIDICNNISEIQSTLPAGYLQDESGDCQYDQCANLAGLQGNIPEHFIKNETGDCIEYDVCLNVTGIQSTIPDDYVSLSDGNCKEDVLPIRITEILPNPSGADTGKEFIELYNPNNNDVDIGSYVLQVGVSAVKKHSLAGHHIAAHGYLVIYNNEVNFTLTNTSGQVMLMSQLGEVYSDTGVYGVASEDETWAVVDNAWQYTNQPTPGEENRSSLHKGDDDSDGVIAATDCPVGKYRNPETNRCRAVESTTASLASCDAGQYRSAETNRCRKIVAATALTPCKDGQYRSEETNRCRNIASSGSSLTPCKEGQERSQETNRCRAIKASAMPSATYAVEPVKDGIRAFVGWWILGGIGLLAVGYAGWEWRHEIGILIKRMVVAGKGVGMK